MQNLTNCEVKLIYYNYFLRFTQSNPDIYTDPLIKTAYPNCIISVFPLYALHLCAYAYDLCPYYSVHTERQIHTKSIHTLLHRKTQILIFKGSRIYQDRKYEKRIYSPKDNLSPIQEEKTGKTSQRRLNIFLINQYFLMPSTWHH